MKKEVLKAEIDKLQDDLTTAIHLLHADEFNKVPFEGSWSAAQVAEHLVKAVDPAILYGNVEDVKRDPAGKIENVKSVFLNFNTKMQSPRFVMPSHEFHKPEEMLYLLDEIWERMKEAVQNLDLSQTCTDFEIPGFGRFTRLEWVWFYIFHTMRHIRQLQNIAEKLRDAA